MARRKDDGSRRTDRLGSEYVADRWRPSLPKILGERVNRLAAEWGMTDAQIIHEAIVRIEERGLVERLDAIEAQLAQLKEKQ